MSGWRRQLAQTSWGRKHHDREEASELRGWLRPEQLEEAVRGLFSVSEAQGPSGLSPETWGTWKRKVGGQLGAPGRGGGEGGRWENAVKGEANTVRGWVSVRNLEKPLLNSI